jgi:hypothetical protein
MRRAFDLSEVDREFLDARGQPWEASLEGQNRWVLIENFDLPAGYNYSVVSVALLLPASYPDVQIDMAYFFPALARKDAKAINALSNRALDQKTWQQWSRHRVEPDAWRPGVDNIETHLRFVTAWLEEELHKR